MTFRQETRVYIPFETKHHKSFPKCNQVCFVPECNRSNVGLMRQDRTSVMPNPRPFTWEQNQS